jgi:ABC-type Fe3+/spermidine/putrescine transport system ATPase subunit
VSVADRDLVLRGLKTRAGSFELGSIDLTVPPNQVLAILGPSGAGKTMLLDTIAGFRKASAGQVVLCGRDVTSLAPEARRIGVVFQDAALFPHLSVRENVRFGERARGAAGHRRSDDLLDEFGLGALSERAPRSLSGGERQRVALARVLASDPELMLLDEPLSALDQPTREELRSVLQGLLAELRIPAIHVTHDREEALSLGDEVGVIVDGRLRQLGTGREVVTCPADEVVARLLGWLELGHGTLDHGRVSVGDLTLRHVDDGYNGPVWVFYRPEEVILGETPSEGPATGQFFGVIESVLLTVPLARVTVGAKPGVTVLMFHRDLNRLALRPGSTVTAVIPPSALRLIRPSVS